MRIDVHTHAFPHAIASKAVAAIEGHYCIKAHGSGRVDDLLATATSADMDRVVVLCTALGPAQVIPANNWALQLKREHPDRIEPFGSLHPNHANWEAELARLKKAGIRGLKFHAEFQGFSFDHPSFMKMIEAAWPDFVLLFHAGHHGSGPKAEANATSPRHIAALLDAFPRARIIAAHLGGQSQWEEASEHLLGREIYLDTSSCAPYMDATLLREFLKRHDRSRLLYGSDWPIHDPVHDLELLRAKLGISSQDLDALLANAQALLPLPTA